MTNEGCIRFISHCSYYKQGWNEEKNYKDLKSSIILPTHHNQREGIMAKLEENGYAYLQSAIDHSLVKNLHDEISDLISNSTKEWKCFNHSPSAEYLPLPMVCT